MDEEIKEVIQALLSLKNIVIVGHAGADGDSIGSGLALASFLRRMGLRVTVYQSDRIPAEIAFLNAGRIKVGKRPDLAGKDGLIFMECFIPGRSGYDFDTEELSGITVFNIDHHPDNKNYADYNIVDPEISSVAEIIFHFFRLQGLPLLKEEASNLLTGILTDTGRFSQKNTTPESLRIASELAFAGADANRLYNLIYGSQTLARIRLMAETLGTIEILNGSVAVMHTDVRMMDKSSASYDDTKDFINFARDIEGVEAACYMRETDEGKVHINFRSLKKNILPFVKKFGGGGHRLACGVTIEGKIASLRKGLIRDFADYITGPVKPGGKRKKK